MPRSHAKLVYINSCYSISSVIDRLLFLILLFSIQFNLNLPYNLRAVKAKTLNFSRRYILQRSLMWSPQIIIFEELCNHVAFVWSRQECWVMHTVGSEQCVQSSLTYAFRANKSRSRVSDKLLCMYINWVSVHNQNLNGTRVFYIVRFDYTTIHKSAANRTILIMFMGSLWSYCVNCVSNLSRNHAWLFCQILVYFFPAMLTLLFSRSLFFENEVEIWVIWCGLGAAFTTAAVFLYKLDQY